MAETDNKISERKKAVDERSCTVCLKVTSDKDILAVFGCVSRLSADCKLDGDRIIIGFNDVFDVDVNVMARRTIKDFIGREELLRELQRDFSAEIWLEISPYLQHDCKLPNQMLSLDGDIIAFLYKSGVKLDLDYYVI